MKRIFTALILLLFYTGCSRAIKKENSSSLVIHAPSREQLQKSGISAFDALPTDRKICFGVSVTGPGIESYINPCSPQLGTVAGFVESGQPIEAIVTRGFDRKIELYAYLMPSGSTATCPLMTMNLTGDLLKSVYLIGSVSGVSLSQETEVVTIKVDFPGLSNHVAKNLNPPASCGLTPLVDKKGFHISNAKGTVSGSGIVMHGRLGRAVDGTIATGSGIKLIGKAQ